MTLMLIMVLLTFTLANLHALLWQGSDWLVSSILPAVIVDLTNDERSEESLQNLKRSEVLDHAAMLKAEDMAHNAYFAHYAPDGTSPWYWFDEVGYSFVHAGENLAVHFTDSEEVIDAWMESPGHRANILNEDFTEIGIGAAHGVYQGIETVYVVQLFGTPAAGAVASASETNEVAALPDEVPENDDANDITVEIAREEEDADISEASIETVSLPNEQSEEVVTLYSDLATTSRNDVPIATTDTTLTSDNDSTVIARTATQPHLLLEIVYSVLGLIVLVVLIFSIVIEWKRQHPMQIAYGGGLLAIMALLFYVHTTLVGGVTII